MQYAILIAPCAAVLALAFALFFARKVLKMPEAENTRGIAAIIRRGANAFLKRQYLVLAIFFGCMFVLLGILALVAKTGISWIYGALQKECDPYLFEACVYHIGFMGNENLKQLNLAIAQYYQGNFQQAMDTIMHTDPGSFKKTNRLNYYMLKSSLYFRFGMGDKVRELENEFQRRISSKQDAKNMQILCAVNNLKRARANKDYESAWRFYQEWLHLSDKGGADLWTKVGRAWQQAVLEQDCGNEAAARAAFTFVEKYGNRLFFVKDAAQFLHPQETAKTEEEGEEQSGGTEA